MFYKMGKTNRTSTKFAANILYITGSSSSKSSDIHYIFKEVTTKRSMDPSLRTRDWLQSVVNFGTNVHQDKLLCMGVFRDYNAIFRLMISCSNLEIFAIKL